MGNPAFPEDTGQSWVVDVVESCFDVEKEEGHLQARSLQGSHVVHEGEAGIIGAQPREGAAVVGVNQTSWAGCEEEACCYDPFQDLRDSAE